MTTNFIKDPLKVKLREYEILAKVKRIEESIVLIDKDDQVSENEYLEVVKVMSSKGFVTEGDKILKVSGVQTIFEVNGEKYVILRENSILIAVDSNNFKTSRHE